MCVFERRYLEKVGWSSMREKRDLSLLSQYHCFYSSQLFREFEGAIDFLLYVCNVKRG